MRISDWSSDVCSSELGAAPRHRRHARRLQPPRYRGGYLETLPVGRESLDRAASRYFPGPLFLPLYRPRPRYARPVRGSSLRGRLCGILREIRPAGVRPRLRHVAAGIFRTDADAPVRLSEEQYLQDRKRVV